MRYGGDGRWFTVLPRAVAVCAHAGPAHEAVAISIATMRVRSLITLCARLPERGQVVAVEDRVVQPFDRAEEEQPFGHRLPVGADQVDFDVVAAGPVAADRRGAGQELVRQQTSEGFPDEGFDRPAPMSAGFSGPTTISRPRWWKGRS